MKKLLYVEEEFLYPTLCKPFIDLHLDKNESFLEAVTHSSSEESLSYGPDIPEPDGDYGAIYLGGNVTPVDIKLSNDKLFASVIANVTNMCKSFRNNIQLDYCGVIRWPTGTFMKPHYDKSEMYSPNVLAAFLYLNDNFVGGHTQFDNLDGSVWHDVKPKAGKLLIFSNREYLHHVSKVESGTRYVLSFWFNTSVQPLTPPLD
tara:strand:- start:41 stop:649 length:609 start_codon:yes stop_codon:yes gene_type:complete